MWYKVYVTLTITHQIRKPGKTRVLPAKVRVTTCAPAGPSRLMKASGAELLDFLKGAMMIVKALSSDNDTVFVKEAEQAIARASGEGAR